MFEDPTQLYKITYQHTHFMKAFTILDKKPKTRHACLDVGDWCPEQYEEEFTQEDSR